MARLPPPLDVDSLRTKAKAQTNLPPVVLGQAVSLFGDYIAYFTLPLFIVSLTGSATDLGLTAAAETVPMLLFGLAAGVFLDRRADLTRTLVFADAARAFAFVALAVGAYTGVAASWMVFGTAFIAGTMSVAFDSGLQALLPSVLEDDMLVEANSRLQLARTAAMTIGPATGGVLVAAAGGFGSAFLLNAATFVVSAVFLTSIRAVRPRAPVTAVPFRSALTQGLGFLMREPRLRLATIGGTVTNLVFAPLEALLVLYVSERIGLFRLWFLDRSLAAEASIGLFFALQAAIASVGIFYAPRVAQRMRLGAMYVTGLVMLGGGFAMVAVLENFLAVIPAGVALAGAGWVNVALSTMRQFITPPELLGRVVAASRTLAWAGLPVGAAMGGVIAESAGLVPVYLAGSGAVIAVAVVLRFTQLWSRPVGAAPARAESTVRSTGKAMPTGTTIHTRATATVGDSEFDEFGPVEWGLLGVVAFGFGSLFVSGSEALERLSPAATAAIAAFSGTVTMGLTRAGRRRIGRSDWPMVALLGVAWVCLPLLLFALALDGATSGRVAVTLGAVPLLSAAIGAVVSGRHVAAIMSAALAIAGLVLVGVPPAGGSWWPGLQASAAAVLVAIGWMPAASLQRRWSAPPVLTWAFGIAAVLLGAVAVLTRAAWSGDVTSVAGAAAAGIVAGLAFTSMAALAGRAGPSRAGVALYFAPVVALTLGVALRTEAIPPLTMLGAAILLAGAGVRGAAAGRSQDG